MPRRVTLANRSLRFYIAIEKPSEYLKTIAEFVLKVYAPMWFTIKSKPSCKDGSKYLLMPMNRSRYLPDRLKTVVDPAIQRNGCFGHPENTLLTMLTDERPTIRELGLHRIMRARASKTSLRGVRCFKVPKLNFDATEYINMIDWHNCVITEPPATKSLSDEELESLVRSQETPTVQFPRFPCHTQAAERCVNAVTETSTAAMG